MFKDVWVKVSGDHDGLCRRNVVVDKEKDRFSPGHIVRPGVVIHFGRMTCGGYIKFLGKLKTCRIHYRNYSLITKNLKAFCPL